MASKKERKPVTVSQPTLAAVEAIKSVFENIGSPVGGNVVGGIRVRQSELVYYPAFDCVLQVYAKVEFITKNGSHKAEVLFKLERADYYTGVRVDAYDKSSLDQHWKPLSDSALTIETKSGIIKLNFDKDGKHARFTENIGLRTLYDKLGISY